MGATIFSAIACLLAIAAAGGVYFGQSKDPAVALALAESNRSILQLRSDLDAAKAEIAAAKADIIAAKAGIEPALKGRFDTLEKGLADLSQKGEKVAGLEKSFADLTKKAEEINALDGRVTALNSQLTNFGGQVEAARQLAATAASGKFAGKSLEAASMLANGDRAQVQFTTNEGSPILRLKNSQNTEIGYWGSTSSGLATLLEIQSPGEKKSVQLVASSTYAKVTVCTGSTCTMVGTGGDVAERMRLAPGRPAPPGTALSIAVDASARVMPADREYDTRFVGIVSGAGGIQPALVIGNEAEGPDNVPVALTGIVYAWADAGARSIQRGDLLTTSATPGHLMGADPQRIIFGALAGKALDGLTAGRGLIRVALAAR